MKPLVTEALKRREFHFLTAAFACGTGAAATVASSLETLLNCMGASHDLNIIMGLLIIGTCLTAIPIGILSDYYSHRVNRLGYSLPSSIGFFVSCVFCAVLLSADNSGTLVGILSLFVGCYLGSVFSVIPATIVDLYGIQRFPVLWGWLMSASALSYLTQKKIFEAIFNSQLSSHSLCSATLAPHLSLAMPSGYLFASIFLTIGALQMT